jgi:hypothetical protein
MEKTKKSFISKMINHAKGLGKEMNNTLGDIYNLRQRLILKREEVRIKIKEDGHRKKVRRLNDKENKDE